MLNVKRDNAKLAAFSLKRSKAGMKERRSRIGNFIIFSFILLLGLFMALPLIYCVIQSIKPANELFQFPPKFFVSRPTLSNYSEMFQIMSNLWVPFSRYIFNSLLIAVLGTLLHVLFASMAAYPLAKHNFPGKNFIFAVIMLGLMFVSQVTFVPSFILIAKLHILNTYFAYLFPHIGMAIGLFLMKQFISQLPDALIEAAKIDGASEYRTFFQIILPNVKPAIMTIAIFQFVHLWNNIPQDVVYNESLKIVRVALAQIAQSDAFARYGSGMAASVILMLPPIIVFLLLQKKVVETMTFAGIKG